MANELPISLDSASITLPVSGQVSLDPSTLIAVSGAISISGAVQVNQGIAGPTAWPVIVSAPVGVSGDLNVHLPLPLGVSGTVSIGNTPTVLLQGPVGVSGDLNSHLPLPVGVSGTVSANVTGLPLPVGVSGTVTANQGNAPWSQNVVGLPLPIGVSGTVTANVIALPLPVGVSGTVTANQGTAGSTAWPVTVVGSVAGPLGVSGSVNVNVPLPVGVSGTVTANQGNAPWSQNIVGLPLPIGVSGTVSANVTALPLPVGVSGTVQASIALPLGISGTVSANVIALPLPVGVSGTVTANQGTAGANAWPVSLVGSLSGPVGVSGTLNTNFPLPIGVSGTVTANQGGAPWSQNVVGLPLPVGVSGTVSIGNSPTVGILGPIAVSGTVNTALPLPLGVSGTVSANVLALPLPVGVSGTVTANQGTAGASAWPVTLLGSLSGPVAVSGTVNTNFPLPVGVSGTVSIGNSPAVSILGPIAVSGTVNAALPLPLEVSGTVSANVIALPLPVGVSGTVDQGAAGSAYWLVSPSGAVQVNQGASGATAWWVYPAIATASWSNYPDAPELGPAPLSVNPFGQLRTEDRFVKKLLEQILLELSKEKDDPLGALRQVWPVEQRMKAVPFGENPPAVGRYSYADRFCNLHGIPFFLGGHPNSQSLRVNYTAAQTDIAILTPGISQKLVVTRVMVTADKANSVNTTVRIGFGATSTPTSGGVISSHPGIDPGGGFTTGDGSGVLGSGSLNDSLRITSTVPTGGSIDVVVTYFTIDY